MVRFAALQDAVEEAEIMRTAIRICTSVGFSKKFIIVRNPGSQCQSVWISPLTVGKQDAIRDAAGNAFDALHRQAIQSTRLQGRV